jgi:hypothetical protein
MNLCAVKMAAVFMVSTSTVEVRTGFTPHWIEFLGFGCALLLLLSGRYIDWILKDIGKVFVAAVILDVIYELVMVHKIYLGEASVVVTLLAIIRSLLLRAPEARLPGRKEGRP